MGGFFAGDWDILPPLEQARLIRFIVESVEYDGRTEKVTLTLTDEAAANLVQQKQRAAPRRLKPTEEPRVCVGGQDEAAARPPVKQKTSESLSCESSSPFPA